MIRIQLSPHCSSLRESKARFGSISFEPQLVKMPLPQTMSYAEVVSAEEILASCAPVCKYAHSRVQC